MIHAAGEGAGEVQGSEILKGCQGLQAIGWDALQAGHTSQHSQ